MLITIIIIFIIIRANNMKEMTEEFGEDNLKLIKKSNVDEQDDQPNDFSNEVDQIKAKSKIWGCLSIIFVREYHFFFKTQASFIALVCNMQVEDFT